MKKIIYVFVALALCKINLLALGANTENAGFNGASGGYFDSVIAADGSNIRYKLEAELFSDGETKNENWSCAEIETDGLTKTYDRGDWKNVGREISRTENALASASAGSYSATFTFYGGRAKNERFSEYAIGRRYVPKVANVAPPLDNAAVDSERRYVPNAVTAAQLVVEVTEVGFSSGDAKFAKTVTLQVGSTLRYKVSASPRYGVSPNDNWGCTEVQISNIKRFYDHGDWRGGARTITSSGEGDRALNSGMSLKAPSAAGIYDVIFQFYSGSGSNGNCDGDLVGEYVARNAVRTIGDIAFRPTFDMYYRKSLVGDMKVIGASAMCIPEETHRKDDGFGSCQDPQFTTIFENMNLKYAYTVNGAVTAHPRTSRTAAFLNLPPNAKVIYARLYWLGRLSDDYGSFKGKEVNCPNAASVSNAKVLKALNAGANRVKFIKPSGDSLNVKADNVYLETYDGNCAYLARADVTDMIDEDNAGGLYFVEGLKSRRNGGPFGSFGGWSLVTVYENQSDPTNTYRLITLFDGWRGGNDVIRAIIKGFLTPQRGTVHSSLFVMGADGDSDPGDRLCINAKNPWCNTDAKYRSGLGGSGEERLIFPYMKDNAPIRHRAFDGFRDRYYINAFLSTVSEGAVGYGKMPHGGQPQFTDDYVLGFDLHTYHLRDFLANGATQTNIVIEPGGDHIVFGALGFSTIIYNPRIADIKINSSVKHRPDAALMCDNKKDMRGATINYVYTLSNEGREAAENIRVITSFAETGLDKYIASVSKAVMSSEGSVIFSSPFCSSSVKGIMCNVKRMDVSKPNAPSRLIIRYSVTLKNDIPLLEDDVDLEVIAHANYYNAVTHEAIETEARNLTPAIAGKLCANETCKTLAKNGKSNGYYLIDPDWGYKMQPFEVYCDDMNASDHLNAKTYLPLVMTTDFSNLRYKAIKNGDYYHKNNQADKTRFTSIRLSDDYAVHAEDDIIKNGFSNINLVGTPFAIDFDKTAIGTCSAFKKAHFDQIVKIDTELDKTNLVCKALKGKIKLKQIDGGSKFGKFEFDKVANYRDAKFANGFRIDPQDSKKRGAYLYKSCQALKDGARGVPTGFYYINPEENRDTGTDLFAKDLSKHRPFVVFCDMNSIVTNERKVSSLQVVLDGDVTLSADDLISRDRDVCSKLGMYFFVPINKQTFNRTRDYLKAIKPEWSSYTGSVKYNLTQLWSSNSGGMGADALRLFWPYGPFGVFNKREGAGEYTKAFADGTISGAGLPLNSADGVGESQNGGWESIFKYMPDSLFDADGFPKEEKDDWWISDKGCNALKKHGYANGWDLCSNSAAYDEDGCYLHDTDAPEPNGDYAAKQWLYYVADNNGDVYSCNDKLAPSQTAWTTLGAEAATYVYAHYACMTLDSFAKSGGKNELPENFNGWDETLDVNSEPPALYTKMDDQSIAAWIVPQGEIKQFEGALCASIAFGDKIGHSLAPTGAKIGLASVSAADFSPHESDGLKYACARIDPQIDLAATPVTFIWSDGAQRASKDANITLLAYNCVDLNNVAQCDQKSYGGGYFSVRPRFKIASDYYETLIAGADYPTEERLPNGGFIISAANGYTQSSDLAIPCDGDNGLCVTPIDKKPVEYGVLDANISFSDGKATIHKISYDEVGEILLKFVDNDWTKIDQKRDYGGAFSNVEKYKNDCIPNSYAQSVNNAANPQGSPNYGKIGCVTGGLNDGVINEITLKFIPHRFVINKFDLAGAFVDPYTPVGGGRSSFVYYANEADGHFASVLIDAEAINKKGATTKNYGEGNYSKEIAYRFDFPSFAPKSVDMPEEAKAGFWSRAYDKSGALSKGANVGANMWRLGRTELKFGLNFSRDSRLAMPMFFMRAGSAYKGYDFNVSLTDTDDARGAANWDESTSEFSEINFVYGRASISDVISRDRDANVTFEIDYFSDRGSNGIRRAFDTPSAQTASVGWYRIRGADNITEANVSANVGGTLGFGSNDVLNNESYTTFSYQLKERRPRRFVSHLGIPPYLWYHPFGKPYHEVRVGEEETRKGCFEHPCGTIEFIPKTGDGWGGSGKQDDDRYYDDNSTRELAPLRLGR
ncbi:MAG: hypothetical protein LBF86_08690 [Helicobacteraceae bacterium]|jgi:hypothetical protein|nr:hypothetical protein [Helicobacteraceae bacterium]